MVHWGVAPLNENPTNASKYLLTLRGVGASHVDRVNGGLPGQYEGGSGGCEPVN